MNTEIISISSFDDLLSAGIDCISEKIRPENLNFDEDLSLKIRICGKNWDGKIDYIGAQYIIELQNAISRLYHEVVGHDIPLHDVKKFITVRVSIENGSSVFNVHLKDVVMKMAEKINGKGAVFVLSMTILAVGGYMTVGKYFDYKKEIMKKDLSVQAMEKMEHAYDRAFDVIEKAALEKPSRMIVSNLDKDDKISFHNNVALTRDDAIKRYPRKNRVKLTQANFDNTYKIVSIDFADYPPMFTLEYNGFTFKAKAELLESDIDRLSENFKVCLKSGSDFNVNLQIFAVFNTRSLKSASITAIGEKRENTKDMSDLIPTWKS